MTHRLALPSALLCLLLGGCANQQPVVDAGLNQQLASLDANGQSTRTQIGELSGKLAALSAEQRRLQEVVAAQASKIDHDQAARNGAAAALARHIEDSGKRLNELEARTHDTATQADSLKASLREKSGTTRQEIDRLDAQLQQHDASQTQALQAEIAELAERIEASEQQLNELLGQAGDTSVQTSAMNTALNDKAAATNQRIDQLASRIDSLHGQAEAARQADASTLAARLDSVEQHMKEQASASQATLSSGELGQRLDRLSAQAGALDAALPALRETAAAAGPRLDADAARLAALEKRLDEVTRMAQDALDATGLGQRKIYGKVVESVTLTEDKTLFPINSPVLGEQDMAKLDALAVRLKALGTNYHLQIQGHTDGIGSDDYNYELGKARAEAVKNYLSEKNGIPQLRMSVMSYGSLEAASYATKNNRRIVVQVLQ